MELYAGSDLHSRNDLTVIELEEWLHPYETIRVSPLGNHQVYFALKNLVLRAMPVPHCGGQRSMALPL